MTTGRDIPQVRRFTDKQIRDPRQLATLLNTLATDAGNTFDQIAPYVMRDVSVSIPDRWITATLVNSWAAYNSSTYSVPGFYKDPTGRVWLRGAAKDGTYGASAITTLPVGYRPPLAVSFAVVQSNATFEPAGRLNIATDGTVTAPDITSIQTGVSTFLSLEGVSFDALDTTPNTLASSVTVDTRGLPLTPYSVDVVGCWDSGGTAFPSPSVAWSPSGSSVVLSQVSGLPSGRYTLRLRITG